MKDGFFKVAAATPQIRVADCSYNMASVQALLEKGAEQGIEAMVFPELCITGYTCGDLFGNQTLLCGAETALSELIAETADIPLVAVIGVPVSVNGALYNCGAVFCQGRLLGLAAKSSLPNYSEFYELRHFTPAPEHPLWVDYCGYRVPLGRNLLFCREEDPVCRFGVEICEDLWTRTPPSVDLAASGATLIFNLSASDEIVGKAEYRRDLVRMHSARILSGYVYADAGSGESTTDMVFSGHNLIAENGVVLEENVPFDRRGNGILWTDIDLERMQIERRRTNTWTNLCSCTEVSFSLPLQEGVSERAISPLPFVPSDSADLDQRCFRILTMQAEGLRSRLAHTGCRTAVIGLSGGLDSTLALLVTARAFALQQLPLDGIVAVSMPGFGTTSRTKGNAQILAEKIGARFLEIPIGEAVYLHFRDIGHPQDVQDVTYENAQARERTQILMDIANQENGMVIGTGDLSELALGWATYNGDHMSMYGVNSSIPKTLVRHLVCYVARTEATYRDVLEDILATPVSPELLPPVDGEIAQKTEDIVGPYELHDFFLYYLLRFGFGPGKIFRMALRAFADQYSREEILKWQRIFFRRFFAQQFKRSCLPDGPKVGTVTVSPRGDWRMPSDASAAMWLKEIDKL